MAINWRKLLGMEKKAEPPQQKLMPLILWTGVDETLGNIAIGHVRENLMAFLKNERGIHVETLMTAIGALAGHAALHAAIDAVSAGRAPSLGPSLVTFTTSNGVNYYTGNALNAYLVPEEPAIPSLWGMIAAAAVATGVPQAEVPDPREIFVRAVGTIGTDQFGVAKVPEAHRPHGTPRQLLDAFWPAIRQLLGWSNPTLADGRTLPPRYWPYVLGMVARQYIAMSKDVLDPRLSVRLIMEAAVPMSKVDPKTVPQAIKA